MTDLLTRLREATEGNRELDVEIARAFGIDTHTAGHFSTSLDAIKGLIERELSGSTHGYGTIPTYGIRAARAFAFIDRSTPGPGTIGSTPALALCIAAVMAKEAQDE